jgi:hypothetical protein
MKRVSTKPQTILKTKRERKIFDDFASGLNITSLDSWYNISKQDLKKHGLDTHLSRNYNKSLYLALGAVYPDYKWLPWRFKQNAPRGFWNSIENQKWFMDCLGKHLGLKTIEDYTNITCDQISMYGGSGLLERYGGSSKRLLSQVYPQFTSQIPRSHWLDIQNQRDFLDELGTKLGFKTLEDWYKLSVKHLQQNGANSLLWCYGYSKLKLLQNCFPTVKEWDEMRIKGREFLEGLVEKLSFKGVEDFYKISKEDILQHGGSIILSNFGNSPARMIKSTYPEISWNLWEFERVPHGFWESHENQFQFMEWLRIKLKIHHLEDWYKITMQDIADVAPTTLFHKYGFVRILTTVYPEHSWKFSKLEKNGRLYRQTKLLQTLQHLFPNCGTSVEFNMVDCFVVFYEDVAIVNGSISIPKTVI